jgi:hypothetical protein
MADQLTPQAPSTDVPPFPHQLAAAPTSIEATNRLNADPPPGAPRWQPEEGDFS